ncbi:MAG: hypothetical protein M3392_01025 [Actinomycetota bacterium]|nr:hypothetical protein [Actinomycetota bacterium]
MALLALGLASMAAPVFAQVSVVNQNADQVGLVNDSICSQVYNVAVQQYNAGDQNANADAFADATAGATASAGAVAGAVADADAVNIANVTGIDLSTVNACLNGFAKAPGDGTPSGGTTNGGGTTGGGDTTGGGGTTRAVAADVIIDTIPDQKVLADTGGPLILLPALGLLFVTAGATMLRILLRR